MRVVIQRAQYASVTIEGQLKSKIGLGLFILVGFEAADTVEDVQWITRKVLGLRIFDDENHVMNRSVLDVGGEILIVSQFTLFADTRSRRPGFTAAARPELAIPLYERVIALCRERGFTVKTGRFGADMAVASVNDGPVTILFDTQQA